jgi:hypothetical protein
MKNQSSTKVNYKFFLKLEVKIGDQVFKISKRYQLIKVLGKGAYGRKIFNYLL